MGRQKQNSDPATSQDIKKLRNRLSQQAFRRRRADLLRDLRQRADQNNSNESEILAQVRSENAALRDQLAEAHAKLNSLLAGVQALVQSTAPNPNYSKPIVTESSGDDFLSEDVLVGQFEADDMFALTDLVPATQLLSPVNTAEQASSHEAHLLSVPDFSASSGCSMSQQIPNIWSLEYQMGSDVYHDALFSSEQLSNLRGELWVESNSPFSDHISFLQRELGAKTEAPNAQLSIPLLYLATTSALSVFHSIARQDMMLWYAKTRFYYTRDITVWKIRPCEETFNRLHPQYRPTPLQLQCSHPAVIDWVPFPSLRDCLIRCHAANPCIDQVVSDIVGVYVVETLLSNLVANSPPLQVYIKVVDLVQAMAAIDQDPTLVPASLPVSQISDIFSSPGAALAVANYLRIEDGLDRYKLDPGLFVKYPEFYECAGSLLAQGASLKPDSTLVLSFPNTLDKITASLYRNFVAFTCSNIHETLR